MILACDLQQFNSELRKQKEQKVGGKCLSVLQKSQMTNKVYFHINGRKLDMQALIINQIYFPNLKISYDIIHIP